MKKEMESMVGFDVLSEGLVETLSEHELPHAISSRWVKTRKPDGTVRCRLVVRGFDHFDEVVDDHDQTFASTPSFTTLKPLSTLSVAFRWDVSTGDISTAFPHASTTSITG